MKKYAIVFPGQGAQYVGMGKSFYDSDAIARSIYIEASKQLSMDMSDICFNENAFLNQTEYTQKAILVTEIAMYEAFKYCFKNPPQAFCGFSLGEYAALYAANVFDFRSILDLLDKRSKWMEDAAQKHPGSMVAVFSSEEALLQDFCQKTTQNIGLLQVANDNSPTQKVLSGTNNAIEELLSRSNELGIKRAVRLNVSGPFHTLLMHEAAVKIRKMVEELKPSINTVPVVMNATAEYLVIEELPTLMEKQMESTVLFQQSIKRLIRDGITHFVEIGPGKVLTGLIKKINPDVKCISINEITDFENWEETE